MFTKPSGNTKVNIQLKSIGIITSFSTIEGTISVSDKGLARSAPWELSLINEQRLGSKRPQIRQVVKKSLLDLNKMTEGHKVCQWDFSFPVGDLDQFPSTMDLLENLGVFWWLEVSTKHKKGLWDRFRLTVFPSRTIDLELLASLDQVPPIPVEKQLVMIISTSDDHVDLRPRRKLVSAILGPRYRHPRNHELRETVVKTRVWAPQVVLQSPHQNKFTLKVRCEIPDAVILDTLVVKLVSKIELFNKQKEDLLVFGQKHTTTCLERGVRLTVPDNWVDISQEIADLEIPPVSETTATEFLNATYEIRITMVFRAVNLVNLSRWSTINLPIHVLPSVIAKNSYPINPPPPMAGRRMPENYLELSTECDYRTNGGVLVPFANTPPPPYCTAAQSK